MLCLVLIKPSLEYCAQFWLPQFKNEAEELGAVVRSDKGGEELEIKCYEEELQELGIFNLKKRKLKGKVIAVLSKIEGVSITGKRL